MNDGSLSPSQSDLRDNSRPLDAHKWSEWPEVNQFIDEIYSSYFQKNEQTNIRKKHVKLLLLDLYVAWKEGWKYVGMSFDVNHYKPKSRYNGLNISKKVIEVAYRLEELDLIRIHSGFKNRDTGEGYVSRLERTANLISRFMDARFPEGAIRCDWDREPVILKDEEKNKSNSKLANLKLVNDKIYISKKKNLMDGGIYFVKKNYLKKLRYKMKSFENDFISKFIEMGKISGIKFDSKFIDIGTPKNLKYAKKKFLKLN